MSNRTENDQFMMSGSMYYMNPSERYDFIVAGSGIAGLTTALRASQHGTVLLITKGELLESNTFFAQGGIAAAIAPGDSPEFHSLDTLVAGAEMCEPEAVSILVTEGPDRINDLIELGAHFDRDSSGELAVGIEGAHSIARIVHARGDATGAEVASILAFHVKQQTRIFVAEHTALVDLVLDNGRCRGGWILLPDGRVQPVVARACVLATGGAGQVYRRTTNPWVATGDGPAVAYRAGARLIDMEFIQFHPTALARHENPMFLISEAVRGEGAQLIDNAGHRFMANVHPSAELAPRDVVARAIFDKMKAGHSVYLDATSLSDRFASRFPTITEACLARDINPLVEPIPVAPAAHFIMGGIETDTLGATSIPGLYACGEAACTGVHGANRLASNSLLEGLVFSERIAHALAKEPPISSPPAFSRLPDAPLIQQTYLEDQIKDIMWEKVGLVRTKQGLRQALDEFEAIAEQLAPGAYVARNMLDTARLIATGALLRTESRGGHYREDYPLPDPVWQQRRVVQCRGMATPEARAHRVE